MYTIMIRGHAFRKRNKHRAKPGQRNGHPFTLELERSDDRLITEPVTQRWASEVRSSCVTCPPNNHPFNFHSRPPPRSRPPSLSLRTGVAMARSQAAIIFAVALVVNVLLLRQSTLTSVTVQQHDLRDFGAGRSLFRRGLFTTVSEESGENVRPCSSICSSPKFVVY